MATDMERKPDLQNLTCRKKETCISDFPAAAMVLRNTETVAETLISHRANKGLSAIPPSKS